MKILYINAAFREGSRTAQIADAYLKNCDGKICEVDLGTVEVRPFDAKSLEVYHKAVAAYCFDDPMFDFAKQFAAADRIVIAAPSWNYSIPAVLHSYLELVCTQGITFDLSTEGSYYSKCKATQLTYITTSGGYIPQDDHAFGYIKSLAEVFWNIPDVRYLKAEGLDIYGTDVAGKLEQAMHREQPV